MCFMRSMFNGFRYNYYSNEWCFDLLMADLDLGPNAGNAARKAVANAFIPENDVRNSNGTILHLNSLHPSMASRGVHKACVIFTYVACVLLVFPMIFVVKEWCHNKKRFTALTNLINTPESQAFNRDLLFHDSRVRTYGNLMFLTATIFFLGILVAPFFGVYFYIKRLKAASDIKIAFAVYAISGVVFLILYALLKAVTQGPMVLNQGKAQSLALHITKDCEWEYIRMHRIFEGALSSDSPKRWHHISSLGIFRLRKMLRQAESRHVFGLLDIVFERGEKRGVMPDCLDKSCVTPAMQKLVVFPQGASEGSRCVLVKSAIEPDPGIVMRFLTNIIKGAFLVLFPAISIILLLKVCFNAICEFHAVPNVISQGMVLQVKIDPVLSTIWEEDDEAAIDSSAASVYQRSASF